MILKDCFVEGMEKGGVGKEENKRENDIGGFFIYGKGGFILLLFYIEL